MPEQRFLERRRPPAITAGPRRGTSEGRVGERDLLDLLLERYTAVRAGTIADRWVRAEHVAVGLGYFRDRVADFIAIDKYPSNGLAIHGHEVKVSRADWLAELRDPSKAAAFTPYTHYWWLVVSDAAIVRDGELPAGWGLLVPGKAGLRAKIPAVRATPAPLPAELSVSLMAAAARTASREPLRRDAVTARLDREPRRRCAQCGEAAPCTLHQPRAARGHEQGAEQDGVAP